MAGYAVIIADGQRPLDPLPRFFALFVAAACRIVAIELASLPFELGLSLASPPRPRQLLRAT
eukprot:4114902-Prymnesium_polylepis.2